MPKPDARPAPCRYRIVPAADLRGDAAFLLRWRAMLRDSDSQEKIFQSPEFYDYLSAHGETVELLAVRERAGGRGDDDSEGDGDNGEGDRDGGAIAGIVPVWLRERGIDFQAGGRLYASMAVPSIVLLGSVPLLPGHGDSENGDDGDRRGADPALLDWLFQCLLARYPRCQAIALSALPADSGLWRRMSAAGRLLPPFSRHYALHLQDDWRDCHRIPLPADFDAYLSQFNAKKRYNLKRQLRLLREHGQGRLDLHRIERPDQVGRLSAALGRLAEPEHRRRLLSDRTLREFAERGLLLCYVMECAGQASALMLGVASDSVLHVYNIFHDSALDHLSAGTAIMHLAIEDLCGRRGAPGVNMIDLGYGTPAHHSPAGNVTVRRAQVLLLRPTLKNRLACRAHRGFGAAVAWVRRLVRRRT